MTRHLGSRALVMVLRVRNRWRKFRMSSGRRLMRRLFVIVRWSNLRSMAMDIKFHEGLTLRWFETPEWSVFVDERGVPNGFEHAERGDECGGGLWFDGRVLVDYDGVFSLPAGVIALCEKLGFNMDYAKETADE
jgi:hypothetical protein